MSNALHYTLAPRDPKAQSPSRGLNPLKPLQSEMSTIGGLEIDSTAWNRLEAAWDGLQAGAFEPRAVCWHGWSGVQNTLDSWRADHGIWRAQQVWGDWKARVAWCRVALDGNVPTMPEYPCQTIPEWVEDRVWMSLLPSPGLGLGVYPVLVDFGKPLNLQGRLLRNQQERLVLGLEPEHPILWDPLHPEVRSSLLHQAHLQGAVFQRL